MSETTSRGRKKKMIIDLDSDSACEKSLSVQEIPPSRASKKSTTTFNKKSAKTN